MEGKGGKDSVPLNVTGMVFDLDGTLLDFEGVSHTALNEALAGLGEVSWSLHGKIVGMRAQDWARIVLEANRVPTTTLDIPGYIHSYHQVFHLFFHCCFFLWTRPCMDKCRLLKQC